VIARSEGDIGGEDQMVKKERLLIRRLLAGATA
jgi:hypothetical protein